MHIATDANDVSLMTPWRAPLLAWAASIIVAAGCTHTFDPPTVFDSDSVNLGMIWNLVQDQSYDAFNLRVEVYDGYPENWIHEIPRSYMVINGDTMIVDREIPPARWSIWIPREEDSVALSVVTMREKMHYAIPYPRDNTVHVPRTVSRTAGARLTLDPPLDDALDSVFIVITAAIDGSRQVIYSDVYTALMSEEYVFTGEDITRFASEGTGLRCDVWRTSRTDPQNIYPAGMQIRIRYRKQEIPWTVVP